MEPIVASRAAVDNRLIDDVFPVLVSVAPMRYDDRTVDRMAELFERYFQRGQRYAVVSVTPKDAEGPDARQRKRIADWASSPRVRDKSRELCVGSATLVKDAIARGALTAILWVWKPANPHHVTTSVDDALDWCLAKLVAEKIEMPLGLETTRSRTLSIIRKHL
ncbi:hypothetical protein [Sandaracinus amylolyticus]|uniref:hypothetical protein n=1 Tax=Sandaracinus amylolyticus TaxID=927083 RepID=UPI001F3999F6|nr:hypothetical protein [Sandaracinus amylolyticus]